MTFHQFTPDGLMFAYALGKAAGIASIAVLPDGLLFGYWGSAPLL